MLTAKIGKVSKVLICGAKGVGKTALLEQLIYGNITLESVSINKKQRIIFLQYGKK